MIYKAAIHIATENGNDEILKILLSNPLTDINLLYILIIAIIIKLNIMIK